MKTPEQIGAKIEALGMEMIAFRVDQATSGETPMAEIAQKAAARSESN